MTEINDYLNIDFKPFKKIDSISEIKSFFEESDFSHFPMVDEQLYLGSLKGDDVLFFDEERIISDYSYTLKGFFCEKSHDLITVLDLFSKNKSNVMPVLDDDKKYVGYYHIEDMISLLCELPLFNEYGGILIVAKDADNYSLGQAAQIVESNNSHLLGLFVSKIEEQRVEITIKLSQDVTDEIIQSFRRFGYEIINAHYEDSYLLKLKERSEYLDKYLNI